ncbi:MAG TPA: hypothetical protein VF462_08690 [Micromonosporaceae bacterium]
MNRYDRPRVGRYALLAAAAALAMLGAGCTDAGPARDTDRQAEVSERGSAVMPFDLDKTTHLFTKTESGGVQTVTADDPGDSAEADLIQQHLRHEADRFGRGDFTDPARIHGNDMPGLATLRDSAGKITVNYAATRDGARITYTTTDVSLVAALHAWFDAQVSDHGEHATHG